MNRWANSRDIVAPNDDGKEEKFGDWSKHEPSEEI